MDICCRSAEAHEHKLNSIEIKAMFLKSNFITRDIQERAH